MTRAALVLVFLVGCMSHTQQIQRRTPAGHPQVLALGFAASVIGLMILDGEDLLAD